MKDFRRKIEDFFYIEETKTLYSSKFNLKITDEIMPSSIFVEGKTKSLIFKMIEIKESRIFSTYIYQSEDGSFYLQISSKGGK